MMKEAETKDAKKDDKKDDKREDKTRWSQKCEGPSLCTMRSRWPDWTNRFDVTIIGAGPAGCMLASCLSRLGINFLVLDADADLHQCGRADGLHARSIEMLSQLGNAHPNTSVADAIAARAVVSNARSIYDANGHYVSRRPAVEMGAVESPYGYFVRQGIVEEELIRDVNQTQVSCSNSGLTMTTAQWLHRPYTFTGLLYDIDQDLSTPIGVTVTKGDEQHTFQTRFLVGADGGKSAVRKSLASFGVTFDGTPAETLFCVIDLLGAKTTLPDKLAVTVYESVHGSVLYIPREPIRGMECFRLYIEVLQDVGLTQEQLTPEYAIEAARKMLDPYILGDWQEINWFSKYADGRFLASAFDVDNRIFLAGDACHTHSPKAAQGMNTSMMDAHNLSWKLALVLKGMVASPQAILSTYDQERRPVAQKLLEFDKQVSDAYRRREASDTMDGVANHAINVAVSELYKRYAGFYSGLGIRYEPNALVSSFDTSPHTLVQVGARLPPATVRRYGDMLEVAILKEMSFDLCFRIIVLIGDLARQVNLSALTLLSSALTSPSSFAVRLQHPDVQTRTYDPFKQRAVERSTSLFDFKTVTTTSPADPSLAAILNTHKSSLLHHDKLYCDDVAAVSTLEYLVHKNKWSMPGGGQKSTPPTLEVLPNQLHQRYDVDPHSGGAIIVVRPDGYVAVTAAFDVDDLTEKMATQAWCPVQEYFEEFLAPAAM